MPSFETIKMYRGYGKQSLGEVRKEQNDRLMEWTWDGDIANQVAYQFDMYNDPDPTKLNDMEPTRDMVPLDIKFIRYTSQTLAKDAVSYHLQIKPSQECNVDYYKMYEDMYHSVWPLGLYLLCKDSKKRYNRWMVVANADVDDLQFPTWELLRCDYVFQYVLDGVKWNVPGVSRSQNSYNSGIWTDYKITVPEDQTKFILPLNRDTEKVYTDQRMIVDAGVLTEPKTWKVSKINRLNPNGLIMVTLAQTMFNPETDYVEKDEFGNVKGMWADYFKRGTPVTSPTEPTTNVHSEMTCSGNDHVIRIGGNPKKFTVSFFDEIGRIRHRHGSWGYSIDGEDASSLVNESHDGVDVNQVKVSFVGGDDYIGKCLEVSYVSADGISSSMTLRVSGL